MNKQPTPGPHPPQHIPLRVSLAQDTLRALLVIVEAEPDTTIDDVINRACVEYAASRQTAQAVAEKAA